jgi:hypothetical protein
MYHAITQLYCVEADGRAVGEGEKETREKSSPKGEGIVKNISVEKWYKFSYTHE